MQCGPHFTHTHMHAHTEAIEEKSYKTSVDGIVYMSQIFY